MIPDCLQKPCRIRSQRQVHRQGSAEFEGTSNVNCLLTASHQLVAPQAISSISHYKFIIPQRSTSR